MPNTSQYNNINVIDWVKLKDCLISNIKKYQAAKLGGDKGKKRAKGLLDLLSTIINTSDKENRKLLITITYALLKSSSDDLRSEVTASILATNNKILNHHAFTFAKLDAESELSLPIHLKYTSYDQYQTNLKALFLTLRAVFAANFAENAVNTIDQAASHQDIQKIIEPKMPGFFSRFFGQKSTRPALQDQSRSPQVPTRLP